MVTGIEVELENVANGGVCRVGAEDQSVLANIDTDVDGGSLQSQGRGNSKCLQGEHICVVFFFFLLDDHKTDGSENWLE